MAVSVRHVVVPLALLIGVKVLAWRRMAH